MMMRLSVAVGELAIGAQGGCVADVRRLERFLAGVERRAFRIAEIALGDRDDALDAVQDAMFALARRYADRPEEEWPALFYTVLRSRITDLGRRRAVRNRVFAWWLGGVRDDDEESAVDPVAAIPGAPGDDPAAVVAHRAALAALTTAVRALPARQQQAFLLRVFEGLDSAATARAMGCSEGSVKTHLARALAALRAALNEHLE